MKFSRADKGEIFGVKEKNHVFLADVLIEAEVFSDVFSLNSFGAEGRRWFPY